MQAGDPVQRLDALVVTLLTRAGREVSRSAARAWIQHGRVLVDGKAAKPSSRVRMGASIEVEPEPPPPSNAQPDASIEVTVLYEDAHLLVIDKRAGLVVHPARGHATGTLVNGLLALGRFDPSVVEDAESDATQRPGIVHRLDKDTSGVMVVARTGRAREGLKALFATHDIERVYTAVVVGAARSATYDTQYGRHPTKRLKFTTRPSGEGKRAVTHVRVVSSLAEGRATLVECRLDTGRTHQIRVHLFECGGTPVLGDALYGPRVKDPALAGVVEAMHRHWLHAGVLGFRHPVTGESLRFTSEWPEELRVAVEALGEGRAKKAKGTGGV